MMWWKRLRRSMRNWIPDLLDLIFGVGEPPEPISRGGHWPARSAGAAADVSTTTIAKPWKDPDDGKPWTDEMLKEAACTEGDKVMPRRAAKTQPVAAAAAPRRRAPQPAKKSSGASAPAKSTKSAIPAKTKPKKPR